MTALIPNAALAYRVLDHIDAHPETWNQRKWDCGTTACFAGHAVRLSGGIIQGFGNSDAEVAEVTDDSARWMLGMHAQEAACHVLGIHPDTGGMADDPETGTRHWLFDAGNDRDRLGRLVAAIFGPRPEAPPVDRWSAMVPDPHPMANCGPLTLPLPPGTLCPTCGTIPPVPGGVS
ncbi:hypothetical protein ACTOB_001360 [Actinoplanes oblitus]|uniref:Uncharacterized protein n=1 Tax=Actinoplanes oblitus TaxID=3040509 RepID=A0ABY8WIV2_9ACTN|nr:hypothetical protein [Actinoplanes oblitus]WIM97806.1 hypothetical protein ACTOB_001360 [Actinoplanes oblitus]